MINIDILLRFIEIIIAINIDILLRFIEIIIATYTETYSRHHLLDKKVRKFNFCCVFISTECFYFYRIFLSLLFIFHNIIFIFLDFAHYFLAKCIFYCVLMCEEIVKMKF